MKVILRNDYEGLGKSGQVINVADGYARNFLIPRNIALSYTASNQRILEEDKKVLEVRKNKEKSKFLIHLIHLISNKMSQDKG